MGGRSLKILVDTRGCVTLVALPFTCKSILRPKRNYGNSKYFTIAKIYLIF
jgi:hypothetical protein